jgi:RimK family alpha-L-glutamate ligase
MSDKKILFLGRRIKAAGYENLEQYKQVLPPYFGEGYQVFSGYFEDLDIDSSTARVSITDLVNNLELSEYDFVFMLGWFLDWKGQALAVANYLEFHHVPFLNKEALKQRSSSKISQAVIFGLSGIPIPRTIIISKLDVAAQASIIERLGLPFIFKEANGRKGISNYLVHSKEEFVQLIEKHQDSTFVAQEYIAADRDYRVLCANGKVYMIIERRGEATSHLNNTSQGAAATELPVDFLPPEVQAISIKAAMLLNREFSGVDLIKNDKTGQYYVLEANNMPQMLSGVFPERKAEVLAQLIKDQLQ